MSRPAGEAVSSETAADAVRLVPATPRHAEVIAGMWGELGYPTAAADVERRLRRLDPSRNTVRVALAGDEVVGWVHALVSDRLDEEPFAELGGLIVAADWRGRGIGRRLLASAEAWGLEAGCSLFRIRSHERRREAHRFYERVGYRRVKRQQVLEKAIDEEEDR